LAALAFAALALPASSAWAGSITLTGSDATGYLSLSAFNTEAAEPNTGNPQKTFDYPYYFNTEKGLWDIIIAGKLSKDSVYAEELAGNTVYNKSITDADFSQAALGSLTYDDALVSASGTSVISVDDFALSLSASDYSPFGTPRNVNNEFSWFYEIKASNLRGNGLTFVDGVLTNIDLKADIHVDVIFATTILGQVYTQASTPGFFQSDALVIDGNSFAFFFDVIADQDVPVSENLLTNSHMVLNRSGTIDQVQVAPVPLPASALLMLPALGALGVVRRRRRE